MRNEFKSDRELRALPFAHEGQYVARHTDLPGFFAVIGRRSKTFTIQTDVRALGKRKSVRRKVGTFPDISTRDALARAKSLLGQYQTGERKLANGSATVTLRQAWADKRDDLQKKVAAGKRSSRTLELYDDLVNRLLKNWLDVPLAELGAPENRRLVRERHRDLTRERGDYAANRAMSVLRAIYNHAARIDPLPPNPVIAVTFNEEHRRDTGMGPGDLPDWFAKLAKLPNPVRREFHLLMLLSGSRPQVLARARWEHLDVKRRALLIPDPKGGRARAFYMPLSRHMLVCLNHAKRAGRVLHPDLAQTWIFPAAESASGHIAEHRERRSVLPKIGNDLRQTYATLASAAGVSKLFLKLLMNHKLSGDVTDGYVTGGALFQQLRDEQERLSRYIMTRRAR